MKRHILLFVNVVTRFFTVVTIAIVAVLTVAGHCHTHEGMDFSLVQIIKIFILACVLGMITVIRVSLENKKWMLRLSFIQKRWIFFPLYLGATLLFIYDYGMLESFGFIEVVLYSVYFLVIAGVVTAIAEKKYKGDKRNLTESVIEYKNKIGE